MTPSPQRSSRVENNNAFIRALPNTQDEISNKKHANTENTSIGSPPGARAFLQLSSFVQSPVPI